MYMGLQLTWHCMPLQAIKLEVKGGLGMRLRELEHWLCSKKKWDYSHSQNTTSLMPKLSHMSTKLDCNITCHEH